MASAAGDSVNGFALDLLARLLGAEKGNVAISPWSIATALAMARVGAQGTTATEIGQVLHGLTEVVRLHNHDHVELSSANRLFVQRDVQLEGVFVDTLDTEYGADVGLIDFGDDSARRAINEWVAGETHDRIRQLIGDGALNELTRLVLVNAVYLRADWAAPFTATATTDGPFHTPGADVTVPLMRGREHRGWAEGDGWKAVTLDYVGGELAMTVLVPDAGRFDEIASHLDAGLLHAAVDAPSDLVDLTMPKFDIGSRRGLKEELSALGMPTAFDDDRADFRGITRDEPLVINEVIHQADVTVDEQGTVAAAATAVVMQRAAAVRITNVRELIVDRPFLFFLYDRPTGVLVFAGQVTDPG